MQKTNSKRNILPTVLLLLSLLSTLIIILFIYLEYQAREKDYNQMMERQATMFIGSISNTIQNALSSTELLEQQVNKRILSSLNLIEILGDIKSINNTTLDRIRKEIDLDAIYFYDRFGSQIRYVIKPGQQDYNIPQPLISNILTSTENDTIIRVYDSELPSSEFLTAFIHMQDGGLLAAIIGQKDIFALRSIVGIGYLMKRLQAEQDVEYLVIQNNFTIVAGSFGEYKLSTFSKDTILQSIMDKQQMQTRITHYQGKSVFEALSPFSLNDEPFGVLRLGLSMDEFSVIQSEMQNRMYILLAVLIILGTIVSSFLISYRQRILLQRDLGNLKHYTNTVLDNLLSAVIQIDEKGIVQTINRQALTLLKIEYRDIIRQHYKILNPELVTILDQILKTLKKLPVTEKRWLTNDHQQRFYSIRVDQYTEQDESRSSIILIDDITEQMQLEEAINRAERLSSMRNLASSVAHEIKNPLNAIKLIVDLLIRKKVWKIEEDAKQLKLVNGEIVRISEIIDQYLRFNRPVNLDIQQIDISELLEETCDLFSAQFEAENIRLNNSATVNQLITGDRKQLKQVFLNILKNAAESISGSGQISISGTPDKSSYEIQIRDNGCGIASKDLKSIFDIHFSTKKTGSGIGLTVVQQIIDAHTGKIEIESHEGDGTLVKIQLPMVIISQEKNASKK